MGTLKDEGVASRRRADLHVERVPLVVELYDAAERMHDLHVLQCQKASMSHVGSSSWATRENEMHCKVPLSLGS